MINRECFGFNLLFPSSQCQVVNIWVAYSDGMTMLALIVSRIVRSCRVQKYCIADLCGRVLGWLATMRDNKDRGGSRLRQHGGMQ